MQKITFNDWIAAVFDHTENDFSAFLAAVDAVYPFNIPPQLEVNFLTQTFESAEKVLDGFSDTQLGFGLWFLVTEAMQALRDPKVSASEQRRCIRAINVLYVQIFAQRCVPGLLGHLDRDGAHPLNTTCYMWWDIFPFWGSTIQRPELDELLLTVMVAALHLENEACRESALHGLGHLPIHRETVQSVISQFLAQTPTISGQLRAYALAARDGCIL